MCGRYAQTKSARAHAKRLTLQDRIEAVRPETWNLAPTTPSQVVRAGEGGMTADWLTWGFRNDLGASIRPINARIETAASKPLFREAWKARRCVVAADGWFEWREEHRRKQPYYFFRKDGEPLFFAGLWAGDSFAILTTAADGELTQIHTRRPLALGIDQSRAWIDRIPQSEGALVAKMMPADDIVFYPVSALVSSPRNDGPELILETKVEAVTESLELDLFPNPA